MMCCGRASASASAAGFSTGAADDRLDDLGELRRMRRREKHPDLPVLPILPLLPVPPDQPHVRDRAVRIEQIAALLVDALDRRAHLVVA